MLNAIIFYFNYNNYNSDDYNRDQDQDQDQDHAIKTKTVTKITNMTKIKIVTRSSLFGKANILFFLFFTKIT